MASHNDLGKAGEDAAVRFLEDKGYQVLHRNWKRGSYEVDIIARNEEEIIFVEIKTRSDSLYHSPEEAVSNKKINRIVSAADVYVKLFRVDLSVRFDIIGIVGYDPYFQIDHIEDAFYPPMRSHRS